MAGQGKLAAEVRAGLSVVEGRRGMNQVASNVPANKLDELLFRKPVRQHVKEFADIFAIIFVAVAAVKIYHGSSIMLGAVLCAVGVGIEMLGAYAPALLHPLWKGWMAFAHVLGTVMTTLILSVAWYVALLPIAMILKTLRVKVTHTTFREPVSTYWEDREERLNDFKLLERQF